MTAEQAEAEKRRQAKAAIMARPRAYKICLSCEGIVIARCYVCPNCHGYRFEDNPEAVYDHAKGMSLLISQTYVSDR